MEINGIKKNGNNEGGANNNNQGKYRFTLWEQKCDPSFTY